MKHIVIIVFKRYSSLVPIV